MRFHFPVVTALLLLCACADEPTRARLAPADAAPRLAVARISICCSATLYKGATTRLTATPLDGSGRATSDPVFWSSSNTAVATVDAYGTVRAVGIGYADVTARSGLVAAAVRIQVISGPVVARVVVNPTPIVTQIGLGFALVARAYDQYGKEVTGKTPAWSVDHPAVASISTSGFVRGVAVGTTTARATIDGVTGSVPVTVTVRLSVTISGPDRIFTEGDYTWEAIPAGGDGTYTYTWVIEPLFGNGGPPPQAMDVGDGKTFTLHVTGDTGPFILAVEVKSAGASWAADWMVCNFIVGAHC